MPCYRSRKRFLAPYSHACDETRQNLCSSVHVPAGDSSYTTRPRPYYHSHQFMSEAGNIDLPVLRTPVIVPRDLIASTLDNLEEFEFGEEEEVGVSDDENELDTGEGEDDDENENAVQADHIPLLACYVFPILLAFLMWVYCF